MRSILFGAIMTRKDFVRFNIEGLVCNIYHSFLICSYRQKPLVMYIFTHDQKVLERFQEDATSGALMVNDCLVFAVSKLMID